MNDGPRPGPSCIPAPITAPTTLDDLAEADAASSAGALLCQLDGDGYLLFPALLDPGAVLATRAAVLGALDRCGWLAAGAPIDDALPSGRVRREEAQIDPSYFEAYGQVQRLQTLHELAHHPALIEMMGRLLGEPLLVHPRKVVRIGLPRDPYVVEAHQDYPFNQGSADVLTAWIALGDCPDEMGGLKVLARSHTAGFRPVVPAPNVGGLMVAEPLADAPGWASTDFRAGDVLVFHALTVHAAKRNHTDRLRLSCDFRYQSAADPVTEGPLLPHYFPTVPSHDVLTEGWTSTRSVQTPATLRIVAGFDPFAGPSEPVTSRLVSLG